MAIRKEFRAKMEHWWMKLDSLEVPRRPTSRMADRRVMCCIFTRRMAVTESTMTLNLNWGFQLQEVKDCQECFNARYVRYRFSLVSHQIWYPIFGGGAEDHDIGYCRSPCEAMSDESDRGVGAIHV